MVGGTVVETIILEDRVWVNTVDNDETRNTQCAIYVQKNEKALRISPGDSVWWQGGSAMWTPYLNRGAVRKQRGETKEQRGGIDYDIRIPRIGFSGVSRPPAH